MKCRDHRFQTIEQRASNLLSGSAEKNLITRRVLRFGVGTGKWESSARHECVTGGARTHYVFFDGGSDAGELAGKQAAVFRALIEIHVHDFEGHVLSAVIAHQCRGVQAAKAKLELQLHLRAGREMPVDGSHASRKAGGFY